MMEISQVDIEELGFEWYLSQRPDGVVDVGNHMNGTGNYQYFYSGDSYTNTTNKVVRSYSSSATKNSGEVASDRVINNMKVLPNVISGYDISMNVDALKQNTRSEVLSTPKVIATSGTTAVIRMVQEMYFPTSWNEPETSIGNNTFEYTPAYPEFGSPTDIGIRFEVTPTVSPNNYTITLHLAPQVVALEGWTDYSYPISVTNSSSSSGNTRMSAPVKMPEISRRDVNTNVKVYDGDTVVLGGMLRDSAYQRDDKYPGLGEIPLVGRFFGSQMHYDDKRNLLIFVTARLMSGDGVPVKTNPSTGLFDFHR
jgi:type II secretory pathway component GspD/PulD (secretin)